MSNKTHCPQRPFVRGILLNLEIDKPRYFAYCYGPGEGAAMEMSIREFHKLLSG